MKRLTAALLTAAALAAGVSASAAEIKTGDELHFDLGAKAQEGYIQIQAKDKYDKSKGYGFSKTTGLKNISAEGEGMKSDAVEFPFAATGSEQTFNVDVPNGLYELTVHAGDIARMSIDAEGHYAIMNITSKGVSASVEVIVEDGQLNVAPVAGKADTQYSLSGIDIKRIGDTEDRRKRVFIGGDSITSTYYPLEYDVPLNPNCQGGWGQMLENYISPELYVMNYATGGQCARGFLKDGQFDAVESQLQEGDYFIVGYGINDMNYSNEEEFYECMREMVRRTKAKKAFPIILTTQGRLGDFGEDGVCYKPDRWWKGTSKRLAEEEGVPYIDLHDLASAYFTEIGQEATKGLYWINWSGKQDTLHSCREGAGQMARLICEELNRQGYTDFSGIIRDYGVSDSVTLKSTGVYDGKLMDIQNLAPYVQTVTLLVNSYDENGNLIGTKTLKKDLPAFDVLEADKCESLVLDEGAASCRAYLMRGGKLYDWSDAPTERNFAATYNKAQALFKDRGAK